MAAPTSRSSEAPEHRPGVCLAERFSHVGCRRCAEACPVAAITIDDAGWRVGEACHGCGRCVAACPTDALAPQQELDLVADAGARGALVVDCSRVPTAALPADAIRAPCTGALRPSDWLRLREAAGTRPILVMDRGWCATCPAGGAEHPATAIIAQVRQLRPEAAPELVAAPLAERLALAPRPRPTPAPKLSRRALFGRLEPAAPAPRPGAEERPRAPKLAPAERLRQRAHLAAAGLPPPAGFFPSLEISERCRNHQVCAGVCPTGALRAVEDDGTLGVAFDPLRCIACGQCVARCPERAIRLGPVGDGAPARLTRHAARRCRDCGSAFATTDDAVRCPPCRRSHDLAVAGFALMRRPHAGAAHHHPQAPRGEASA